MDFKILKRSKKSKARLGLLKTPHGEVESFAIKLARNDANIVAIRNLIIVARAVAPLRGRTVARG